MGDSREKEPIQAISPSQAIESKVRAVAEMLRVHPAIADEVSQFTQALISSSLASIEPSLVETVAVDSGTVRKSSYAISNAGPDTTSAIHFGDYEILDKIAQGGMGVVYRARQTKLNRVVALKRIRSAEFANAEQVRRFYAEAEAAGKLDHPGIVPVYDVGEVEGEHFYSMAFVDGESLSDRVKRDGPLRPQEAARFIRESAVAVEAAHGAGIIHRDIKPQNLLIDRAGQVRVTDFGLAKLQQTDSELTREGQVLGTPAYMPPEQALSKHNQVGVRADVYALGATLYFLLAGRPPFQAATLPETLKQVIDNEPLPLRNLDPSIPRDLETICLKTLSKESSRRYATSQDLADDLARWLSGEPIRARRVGRVERAWKWCKRKPMIAGLSAAMMIGAIMSSIVLWERLNATRAAGLVDSLASAEPRDVPRIIDDLDGLTWWAEPRLRTQLVTEGETLVARRLRLHARLALAADDATLADALVEDLLEADLRDVANLRDSLKRCPQSQAARLSSLFRGVAGEPKLSDDQRFRTGLALSGLDPENNAWQSDDYRFLVDQLLATNPVFQPVVWELLRPLRKSLTGPLATAFIDTARSDTERQGAANALAELAADDTARLADLLTYATAEQFHLLYPLVAPNITPQIVESLAEIVMTLPSDDLGSVPRIAFGQRRANAAVTLSRLGEREKVLPVFVGSDDPESITQFIFRCRERGVDSEPLLELLDLVTQRPSEAQPVDFTSNTFQQTSRARYALLLALGEFKLDEIPEPRRKALLEQLADWYATDPSSGVHSASGWLLRRWGLTELATRIDQTPMPYSPDREWFTLSIEVQPTKTRGVLSFLQSQPQPRTLYYTFIVFPEGEYKIGSVEDEPGRKEDERRHTVVLTRPFAILDREITFEELIAYDPFYVEAMRNYDCRPQDAGYGLNWYAAVDFCRWLGQQRKLNESDQAYPSPESLDAREFPRETNPYATWAPRDWPVDLARPGFRLPTEAEWEVAARGGARTAFGYGSEVGLREHFDWIEGNSGDHVQPPRELRPTVRGLFDLNGNLWEWTHNWYDNYPVDAATDPKGPASGTVRVYRGGAFAPSPLMRSASRFRVDPSFGSALNGLRIAFSPSEISE